MIGKVYAIPPQPVDPENTRWFAAGVITIGVEYRDVDPEGLVETYKDNPDQLAELIERSPEGGFSDEGVSLHVAETDGGHEYLRFDVFDDEPHYHYIHRSASDDREQRHRLRRGGPRRHAHLGTGADPDPVARDADRGRGRPPRGRSWTTAP